MRPIQRKVTVRGVGSDVDAFDIDKAFSDESLETQPVSGTRPRVSCPPPSAQPSTRYTFVAGRRRETLSMLAVPVTTEDAPPASRRRPTLRTFEVPFDIRDTETA